MLGTETEPKCIGKVLFWIKVGVTAPLLAFPPHYLGPKSQDNLKTNFVNLRQSYDNSGEFTERLRQS